MYFSFLYLLIGWVVLGYYLGKRLSAFSGKRAFFKKKTFVTTGITLSVIFGLFGVLVNGMYSFPIVMKDNLYAFLPMTLTLFVMSDIKKGRKVFSKRRNKIRWNKTKVVLNKFYIESYPKAIKLLQASQILKK